MEKKSNGPKKGQSIFVEPIRSEEDIAAIKQLLANEPRNLLLFVMSINNGLRVGDLLPLKVGQVRYLQVKESVRIIEGKTKKPNYVCINGIVYPILHAYLNGSNLTDDDYLFKSQVGINQPLTVGTVHGLVKKWTQTINLKGNYGSQSLRKTWGFIQRTKFGVSWQLLARRFNHYNPAMTMRYLDIQEDEVNGTGSNEL